MNFLGAVAETGAALQTCSGVGCLGEAGDFPGRAADALFVVGLHQQRDVQPCRAGITAVAAAGAGNSQVVQEDGGGHL